MVRRKLIFKGLGAVGPSGAPTRKPLSHSLSEIGKAKEAEQWLRDTEFYSLKRALQAGAAAIPYLEARLRERTSAFGAFTVPDFFLRNSVRENEGLCLLSEATDRRALVFF